MLALSKAKKEYPPQAVFQQKQQKKIEDKRVLTKGASFV